MIEARRAKEKDAESRGGRVTDRVLIHRLISMVGIDVS